jgi:translocation and assembly module TamB
MRRLLKIAAWSFAGLLLLIAGVAIAVLVIGNTQSGRALVVRMSAQLTQGHIQLSGIHGSFPSALDLDRLELHDDAGVWLFAEHMSLRWSPGALLERHIKVDSLQVSRLHIERSPLPAKQETPSSTSSLPHADLTSLSIETLELGEALAGQPTALTAHASAHVSSLQNTTAHVLAQRRDGDGTYELHLRLDPASVEGSLQLEEPANGPLENLLKIPGLGALSVSASVSGPRTAEDLELTVDAGPLRARAHGVVNLLGRTGDLDYSLSAPEMTPSPGLAWHSLDLNGHFHGPFNTPTADGHLLVRQLQLPGGAMLSAIDANLTANAGWMTLRSAIDGLMIPGPQPKLLRDSPLSLNASVHLNDSKRPVELTATHRLFALKLTAVTAGEQSAQLDLRLPNLTPLAAFAGQTARGSANITAQVKHDSSAIHLIADADANLDAGTAAWAGLVAGATTRVHLDTQLTDENIVLERLQLNGRGISLSVRGTADRANAQAINARLDLSLPDLTRLSSALAGTLQLSTKVKGPIHALSADTQLTSALSIHGSQAGTLSASLHAQDLPNAPHGSIVAQGELAGAPLRLDVSLEHAPGDLYHVMIQRADWNSAHAEGDITSGATIVNATGNVRMRMDRLGDLNTLLGSTLQGSVAGDIALVPVSGKSRVQLQFEAKEIVAGAVSGSAQLNATGMLDALNIRLTAHSPALGGEPASLDSNAQLNMAAHDLRLASLVAQYHGQEMRLLTAAKVSFGNGLAIQGLKIAAQEALLTVDGRIFPALDIRAALKQLKPELINVFAPGVLASGTIQADAQVQGSLAAPTGQVRLDATGIRAKSDAAQGLPAADLHASAQLMGNTARIDAKLSAGSASTLTLTGRTPLAADGQLNAKFAGNLDFGLLNPLLEAKGRHVTGALTIDTTVTGTAANPEIAGTVRITKGSVRDYTQGVGLSDITGELSGSHGLLRIESLSARAAPGNVSVEGTIGVLQPMIPVSLKLKAKNAQPIASNIVTANLDADLKLTGTARERLDLAGTVHLNRADLGIPSGLPPNVAVLDVQDQGEVPPPPNTKPLLMGLNLTVQAPRQILVKGRGLDAELGGELHVQGTTDAPVISGGFELQRGFFTLASSKLSFSKGSVTFSGVGLKDRIVPTLDFTAATHAAEIVATVRITGLADAPKIELSSTPEMPQDEILARLLFGQSASQLTATQLVQSGAALASLGGGGGGNSFNPVAKVQKALGLDRLSVGGGGSSNTAQGTQSGGASVEAGRYVSSRVFVGVKESTTGASQVGVDVDLTKNLKLQAKLGNGQTAAQGTTPENDPGSSLGMAYQFEY